MTTRLSGRLVNDNTVSPLDFGAEGNGTTDDTAAMNLAIDQLSSGSKILDLNNKTYLITTQLNAIGTGGVIIRNGTFKYTPNSANRGKAMLKVTIAQADSTYYNMFNSGTDSIVYPGDKKIHEAGKTLNVDDGTYLWLEDNRFDFVYKGPKQRPEEPFPRSDRGFKGEMVKVDYSDKTGDNYIYYLDNETNFYYDGHLGYGDDGGTSIKVLTTIDDVLLDNVNIEGPGIVRKNLGGGGASSPITVNGTSREIAYGASDHSLTVNEYVTIDTGDYVSSNTNVRSVVQGVWKITTNPAGNSTLICGETGSWSLEGGASAGHTGTDSHGLTSASDVGPTEFDTWIYTGCEIGISVEYCSNFKMNNCKITGCGEAGVVTYKCYEPEFANCTFEGARPEGSGGLVLGNGCYRPYVHDCGFKGYNGMTIGTTRMKVLRDMSDINLSFYGTVVKPSIKNNKFKVKEIGINIRENAFHVEVSDNNIEVESTFAKERAEIAKYNRLPSAGINSSGAFVDICRNTISGVMHYGVYHRQCHKSSRVGAGDSSTQENIYDEGNGTRDVGHYSARNGLFDDPRTWDDEGLEESTYGHRGIGNELPRFYLNVSDNIIKARNNVPTRDVQALSNLVSASRFGVFVENQTAGRGDSPSTFATRVNIDNNNISGHLASIRLRCVNGRFKGVSISKNYIDTTPYNDRTAGGAGQFASGNTRPGVGLAGFYDDNTWEFETSAPENTAPTNKQGAQKASGVCLMLDGYDEYNDAGSIITKPNIEDIDIVHNVFTRSINWADKSPNSGHTDDSLSGDIIGGTSTFGIYFDCPDISGQYGTVRHINVSFNRVHYSSWFGFCWRTRRTSLAAAAEGDIDGASSGNDSTYANFNTVNVYFSSMYHNSLNNEQLGGFDGYGWNRNDSGAGSTYTLPYNQKGICGRLYYIYYWNAAKTETNVLYTQRWGSSHVFGDQDFGAGYHGNVDDGVVYYGRAFNSTRWG